MARNFTAYPTVAPKTRVYGDSVFKFNPCSFISESGNLLILILHFLPSQAQNTK